MKKAAAVEQRAAELPPLPKLRPWENTMRPTSGYVARHPEGL